MTLPKITSFFRSILGLALFAALMAAAGARADEPSYLVGEYKLPAVVDPSVSRDVATELWAAVYRPRADGRYPLLVFLHGNHGTCGRYDAALGIRVDDDIEYTFTGTCPEGWQPTPNHLGYGYLAADLAARGYVVVSINANRGVTAANGVRGDWGLNLRRGRLVLRHLQQLADWSSGRVATPGSLGFSLQGLIDFGHVGLLGHSRGGEGMRAALAQYRDRKSNWAKRIGQVNFEALFEIGPVDGQTSRILDAEGVAWNVLLPGCDGDVYDLEGIRPFDRMIMRSAESQALPKSSIEVFGANHNFYNTEWQESDSQGCLNQGQLFPDYGGSPQQRQTASETAVPFFLAHVGSTKTPERAARFDPSRPLPAELQSVTLYARGHSASLRRSSNFIIDDFTRKTGRSSSGAGNIASSLDRYQHGRAGDSHDPAQRAALVEWSSSSAYLQVNSPRRYANLSRRGLNSLEFRVKLECEDLFCERQLDPPGYLDFSIRLVNGNGSVSSPVRLSAAALVYLPVSAGGEVPNSVFQTVRIPIEAFTGADMMQFGGVRFSFDGTARGRISLANVRLVQAEAGSPAAATTPMLAARALPMARRSERSGDVNHVLAVRRNAYAPADDGGTRERVVEIELTSTRRFPATDALPTLYIGDKAFRLSRLARGRTSRIVFSIDEEAYRQLPAAADMRLVIGKAPEWKFGQFRRQ